MIETWLSFWILAFIVCRLYSPSLLYAITLWIFIVFFSIVYLGYYSSPIHYKNIPRYNAYEVESILKHGDVICINNYHVNSVISFPKYLSKSIINFRNNHCAIIIEEDHKKYVIESNHNLDLFRNHVRSSFTCHNNLNWDIHKTPLIEYLIAYPLTLIRFFRNESKPFRIQDSDLVIHPLYNKYFYCTLFTGDLLYKNGLIPSSNKIFRYRPREIIDLLQKNGYDGYELVCK